MFLFFFSLSITFYCCVFQTASLDESLIRSLSYTCQGCLAPLCAAIGGFVAQEALKAVTGKFTPLNQMVRSGHSSVRAHLV